MADPIQDLMALGLSEPETRIYATLLKSGTLPVAVIVKKTRLTRKKLLGIISRLEKRGIVTRSVSGRKAFFTAAEPKLLAEILAEDEKKLTAKKEAASKLIEPLRALGVRTSAKPVVHFFAGPDGARSALEDTLKSREKTLRVFFSVADLSEFLGADYFEHYTRRRVSAGLTLHAVRTFERDKRKTRSKNAKTLLSSREEKREVRFVSEDLAFPMTLFLYDQKILGIAAKEENFAFIIESKELSQLQKKLFELTWRSLAIRSIPAG